MGLRRKQSLAFASKWEMAPKRAGHGWLRLMVYSKSAKSQPPSRGQGSLVSPGQETYQSIELSSFLVQDIEEVCNAC